MSTTKGHRKNREIRCGLEKKKTPYKLLLTSVFYLRHPSKNTAVRLLFFLSFGFKMTCLERTNKL